MQSPGHATFRSISFILALLGAFPAPASELPTDRLVEADRARWVDTADALWGYAETSLQETRSAAALADVLEKEGFAVTRGVAGMPTAFVARAGSGSPAIALLAEYDALPGLSQKAGASTRSADSAGAPGHGCGHNLLGTAVIAAAVAANRQRLADRLPGTIVVFGTPAEEQIIGKPFMLREGAFNGIDVALSWHPEERNYVWTLPRLAVTCLDVEFFGKTAHAAGSPWLGRSALDAVELFDHALALMREHNLPTARMHRAIKNGGTAPNIIADYAKVQWFLRDTRGESVAEMLRWVRKAAEGAALGTETTTRVTVLGTTRDPIYNETLGRLVQKHLERVGAPRWDESDVAFAKAIQKELGVEENGLAGAVLPYGPGHGPTASSDVGEVSAAVPLMELAVAARPSGSPAHHWAQTTCAAHPIGRKGMLVAAKVLAASTVDLLRDPKTVAAAKAEFLKTTGGKPYVSPLEPGAVPRPF